jgi:hypothetical protein
MDDADWSPMPSCAVSNKNVVVSSTYSACHEFTGDDCWDSISRLDFDLEDIEKKNKDKSQRPGNKVLVTSSSFRRRLKKSLGSNEAKRMKKSKKKLDALINDEQVVL